MPSYTKRSFSKKPKRVFRKKKVTTKVVKRIVKKELQVVAEKNFKDFYVQTGAGVGLYASGTSFLPVTMLNGTAGTGIVQGTGDGSRLGDQIQIQSLNIKTEFYNNSSLTNVPCNVRVMLIKDKSQFAVAGGVAPTVADVFEINPVTGTYVNLWSPVKNTAYSRFEVLIDKMITCSNGNAGVNSVNFKRYIKLPLSKGNNIHFTGNTGNITDVGGNMYYFMCFTDDSDCKHTAYCRMRYIDLE